jgi:thiol-disulfide isomerase/thioredoxin
MALLIVLGLAVITAAGNAAPERLGEYEFSLREMNTDQELSSELLTDGKPLILHIWAPDCPHCKRHMPYVAALYKKLDHKSVNFVSCSMSDDLKDTREFMTDKKLNFPVMLEASGRVGEAFYEQGWPTTFVLAPGGEFVGWCDTNGPAYLTEVMDLVEKAAAGGS